MATVNQALDGTTWLIDTILGGPVLAGTAPELAFPGDGRVSGTAGCNRMIGSYEVDDRGGIAFGPIATTLMMCGHPDGVMEQERAMLGALERADRCEIVGTHLTLSDGAAELVTARRSTA